MVLRVSCTPHPLQKLHIFVEAFWLWLWRKGPPPLFWTQKRVRRGGYPPSQKRGGVPPPFGPQKGSKGGYPPLLTQKGPKMGHFGHFLGQKGGYPPLLRKFGNFHGGGGLNRKNGHFHYGKNGAFFRFWPLGPKNQICRPPFWALFRPCFAGKQG